jgi:stage V sporulation protein G
MQVTDVRIRKVAAEGKMKAIVSVTFDDEFVVHDIKIIEGQNGLFIAMPSRKMGEGDFRDIAHPINSMTRNKIQDAIFVKYEQMNEEEEAAAEALGEEEPPGEEEPDHTGFDTEL